jgi:dihydrofolate reductase
MTGQGLDGMVGRERRLVAIAAVCSNGVVGADGDQPWRNRDDFARFRRLTTGHVLIMGRRTYDAIGRPLPGRHTIVITRNPDWPAPDGVRVAAGLPDALKIAKAEWPDATWFVAGGGEIWRLAWPLITRLELTEVEAALPGDVTFPDVDPEQWVEVARESRDGFAWVSYVSRERRP